MDPLTILALGSTALTSIGKLASGFGGSSIAKLQEGIANQNTALLNQKASDEAAEGKLSFDQSALDQSRTMLQVNRTLGAETGSFTARNLDPSYGSPLLLEGFSASQGAMDMALIGAKGEMGNADALLTAAGTRAQAASSAGQAAGFGAQASSDVFTGIVGAGTALLNGLGNPKNGVWSNLTAAAKAIGQGVPGSSMFTWSP